MSSTHKGARLVVADTPQEKSYWHTEIAKAYKAQKRRRGWWRMRIGALNKVFGGRSRYCGGRLYEFSDDDAGREDLRILLDHYAHSNPAAMPRIIKARAPWLTEAEREGLLEQVGRSPRYWPSADLADALGLTEAERSALGGVPTIGACDVTPKQRKKMRLDANKERMRSQRRAAGMKPHADSISRAKPWKDKGMSRATWYRQRNAETDLCAEQESRETDLCAVNLDNTAHKTVSAESGCTGEMMTGRVGNVVVARAHPAAERRRLGRSPINHEHQLEQAA